MGAVGVVPQEGAARIGSAGARPAVTDRLSAVAGTLSPELCAASSRALCPKATSEASIPVFDKWVKRTVVVKARRIRKREFFISAFSSSGTVISGRETFQAGDDADVPTTQRRPVFLVR